MVAIKLNLKELDNTNAIEAFEFLTNLGHKRFKKHFVLETDNEKQLIALANHIRQYRIENGALIYPEKGLFLVSKQEKFLLPVFRLISFYITDLINENRELIRRFDHPDHLKPTQEFCSTRKIVAQLVNRNPHEILLPYKWQKQILYISEFAKEEETKLSNYNRIDALPDIILERFNRYRFYGESLMYFTYEFQPEVVSRQEQKSLSKAIFKNLVKRYDQNLVDILFEMCDMLIFSDSFRIECATLQPNSKSG